MATTLNIRLPEAEAAILADYAARAGRTKTDVLRELIRALGAAEPKPAPVESIGMGGIALRRHLRETRPERVKSLMASMKVDGLRDPIVLEPRAGAGYWLVAGAHRFEAARRLKWKSIQATILDGADADRARLAGIDEALSGADLTPAERALHRAARKEIQERLSPKAGRR